VYRWVIVVDCVYSVQSVCVCVYRWVHLVCALYVPGVAFSNVDKLDGVTLFEMPYTKWGAKVCPVPSIAAVVCICTEIMISCKQCC